MSAEAEPQRVVGFSVSVLPPPLARPCRDEQPASPLAQLLQHQGQLLRRPLSVRTCCNRRGEDQRSKATLIQMGTPTSVFERGSSDSASSSVVSTPAIVIPDTARAIRADAQWQLDPCIAGELLGGVDLCLLGNTQAAAALPLAALLQMKEKLVQDAQGEERSASRTGCAAERALRCCTLDADDGVMFDIEVDPAGDING